jgi:hypothetical protein
MPPAQPFVGAEVIYVGAWARGKRQGWGYLEVPATVMAYEGHGLTVDSLYVETPYGDSLMEQRIPFSPVPKYRHWSWRG